MILNQKRNWMKIPKKREKLMERKKPKKQKKKT